MGRLAVWLHASRHGDPPAAGAARGPVPLAAWLHAAGFWMVAVIAAIEVRWQIVQVAEGVWTLAVTTAAAMLLAGAPMAARRWLAWPFGTHWRTYTLACSGPLLIVLAVVVLGAAVFSDGDPSPLLYLPVANPLGRSGRDAVGGVARLEEARRGAVGPSVPGSGRCSVVAHAVRAGGDPRHCGDSPVGASLAGRAVGHGVAVGVHGAADVDVDPVGGDRSVGDGRRRAHGRRAVWVAGASWMAVVVAKLFLVDLRNLTAGGPGGVVHRGGGPAADRRLPGPQCPRPGPTRPRSPARIPPLTSPQLPSNPRPAGSDSSGRARRLEPQPGGAALSSARIKVAASLPSSHAWAQPEASEPWLASSMVTEAPRSSRWRTMSDHWNWTAKCSAVVF